MNDGALYLMGALTVPVSTFRDMVRTIACSTISSFILFDLNFDW